MNTRAAAQSTITWARAVARRRIGVLDRQLARLERKPDADAIHDTRVATRRLRAALRHLEPCFPAQEVERLNVAARGLARTLGELRDMDIVEENLLASARTPSRVVARLIRRLQQARVRRFQRAVPLARQLRRLLPGFRNRLTR